MYIAFIYITRVIYISGPFWICLTLTFATGITGNLASYLAASTEETYVWRYEFRKGKYRLNIPFVFLDQIENLYDFIIIIIIFIINFDVISVVVVVFFWGEGGKRPCI